MDHGHEINHMQESRKGIHHKLLPAPTAGTEWEFRMVIQYGDVIEMHSSEQDGRTDIVSERIIDQSQHR